MTNRIGWQTFDGDASIKAGSSGTLRIVMGVDDGEGGPVSSYDGWTATIVFFSPYSGRSALELSPDVIGDAGAKTLTMDMEFDPNDTALLRPGAYSCNAVLVQPGTNPAAHWLPFGTYTLIIEG